MLETLKVLPILIVIAVVSQIALATEPSGDAPTAPEIRVVEFGVGTGVVDRRLEGEADTFEDGTQVWFWNRVEGGGEGDRIHHVWLRGGEEVLQVGLGLGGPHWRTWSNKVLHPGSTGEWAVEARDESGAVLARATFVCR